MKDGMARGPTVSVLIPAYNASRFIAEAIQSVLAQTFPATEVIVVDDGSTDDTAEIVARFGGRVSCSRQTNLGVALARNHAIRRARGEYIAFLDADDVWLPHKLEKQLSLFRGAPDLGAVGCGCWITDDHLRKIKERLPGEAGLRALILGTDNGGLFGSTIVAPRAVLEKVGLFDPRLSTSADWDLATRIAEHYPVSFVAEALLLYRQHGANMHRGLRKMEADMLLLLEGVFERTRHLDISGLRHRAYGNLYRMLSGSYWHSGDRRQALRCGVLSMWWQPSNARFVCRVMPGRRAQGSREGRRP
jgi:glycosyltransferase involved in cell wall biosynthesis